MRKSTLHPQLEELRVTPDQSAKFDSWLAAELADAKAARTYDPRMATRSPRNI